MDRRMSLSRGLDAMTLRMVCDVANARLGYHARCQQGANMRPTYLWLRIEVIGEVWGHRASAGQEMLTLLGHKAT